MEKLVSARSAPGRSFSVGKVGFLAIGAELFVATVFVRDGGFDVYDGNVATVLNVSDR